MENITEKKNKINVSVDTIRYILGRYIYRYTEKWEYLRDEVKKKPLYILYIVSHFFFLWNDYTNALEEGVTCRCYSIFLRTAAYNIIRMFFIPSGAGNTTCFKIVCVWLGDVTFTSLYSERRHIMYRCNYISIRTQRYYILWSACNRCSYDVLQLSRFYGIL